MARLRRLVMVRHGETVGNSSSRFHGSADVALSDTGREQIRETSRGLATEAFDLAVASPLSRAWEAARILTGGAAVRLERDLREIDFGRWEGLTREEIEVADPVLYRDWQGRVAGFEFPGGELRADFQKRVLRGLDSIAQSGASSVLVVAHKGPIRTLFEQLAGEALEDGEPGLACAVGLSLGADAVWRPGRRGSNPAGLA